MTFQISKTNTKRKQKQFFDEGDSAGYVLDNEFKHFKVNVNFEIHNKIKSYLEKRKIAYKN